ncbi:MAG TPA: type II toxin-antitoxin system VapC family toxin [Mycobacteriales bacterium]|nr:type II toxin-antitoxin system VapC family toxin [Mycobacteriales bacterium]
MTQVVVDSSALVAWLIDAGQVGEWVGARLASARAAAPELVMYEAANVLRRQVAQGRLTAVEAGLAHADLQALTIDLWPYAVCSDRVWQLRGNLTAYDASYVAVAELLGADLLTLDAKLSRAPGSRCRIVLPPG